MAGPLCGLEGLYIGSVALIELRDGSYCLRAEEEVAALLAAAYGLTDCARTPRRLRRIASHMNGGELVQATIAALHLRFGEIEEYGIARVLGTEALLRDSFDPARPRDHLGRWTSDGNSANGGETSTGQRPALIPAQELVPFLARPPFLLEG